MNFDVQAVRAQFPIFERTVNDHPLHYLDSGASSQLPGVVLQAVNAFETRSRANVRRGVHTLAEEATDLFHAARDNVARYLNGAATEVVFTSGATAAINLVAQSFGETLNAGDEVVISLAEHHSNFVPWQMLRDRRGIVLKAIPVGADGRLDLSTLSNLVTDRCRLIAVTHASNVTGALTDTATIVAAARAVGAKVLLDGAQRAPHGPIDIPALGVDFYAFSGHKMFAPNGIGVLWGRREILAAMPPFMGGGEMIRTVTLERTEFAAPPHRFEAGTPPIAQAIGLGAAARWLMQQDWAAVAAHEMQLAQRLMDGLGRIGGVRVVGPTGLQSRVPVISFTIDGVHPHDLCQMMDSYGVALRGGHHCAQPLHEHFDLAGTSRASIALYNDQSDIDALLEGLGPTVERLR